MNHDQFIENDPGFWESSCICCRNPDYGCECGRFACPGRCEKERWGEDEEVFGPAREYELNFAVESASTSPNPQSGQCGRLRR